MPTLCSDSHGTPNAVCYEIYDARGNGEGGVSPTLTGDHENRITDYSAIVCYTAKQYAKYTEDVPTLRASGADIGGGQKELSCYAIDSHPMDSRMRIVYGACPTIAAHLAKVGCDGPLVLIRKE